MDARVLERLVAELRHGDALFLVHQNADPDAVGSAFALARAFGGTVGETGGVSASGQRLAARVGAVVDPMPHPAKHGRVVAVDTSSRVQLGSVGRQVDPGELVVVDHHAHGDLADRARVAVVDATRGSTAEVVVDVLDAAGIQPDAETALALATAIVADTARFRYGGLAALRAFLRVAEPHGFTVGDCARILEEGNGDQDASRRLAHLKAASRVTVHEHAGFLFAESHVGAFEASAARGLVRLGADLAVVAAERGLSARVSLRASHALLARGVDLGEVATAVTRDGDWAGGGHAGAAGLNGAPPALPHVRAVVDAVQARLAAGGV